MPAGDQVAFDRQPVDDGDLITVSPELALRVIATPGHTFHHVSYAMENAVFTGGSLLYGSVGRTDLVGAEHASTLARAQHASVRRLAELLPGEAEVYPTHGFGSFCAATPASGSSSTIAAETTVNPALTQDEDTFVAELLRGLGDYPAYYAHMAGLNADGPDAPDLTSAVAPVNVTELTRRIKAGEWVVDLRHRTAEVWVHCAGGYRASIAASLLDAAGREVVAVEDSFEPAAALAGLPVIRS